MEMDYNMSDMLNYSLKHDVDNGSQYWTTKFKENCVQSNNTYGGYYNTSQMLCLEAAPVLTSSSATKSLILTVLAVLSFIGNVATIYSIHKSKRTSVNRHSWSAVYTLIFHLSVADLLVTIFCIGGEAAWTYTVEWLAGNAACKIFKFLEMFSLYLSTFVLVLIGVDRFFAVRYPLKSLNTAQRCNRLLVGAWILSTLFSIPQLVIFRDAVGPFIETFHQCVTHGFYQELWHEQLYTTFSLFTMFLLPLVILICTYVCTIATITRSGGVLRSEVDRRNQSSASDVNRRRLIHRAKMKSLRISVVIVAAFIVCWTPYYTMMIIFMFLNPDKQFGETLLSYIFAFGMSNSLINPLIYGAFHLWPRRKHNTNGRRDSRRSTSILLRRSTTGSTRVVLNGQRQNQENCCPDHHTPVLQEEELNSNNDYALNHLLLKSTFVSRVILRCSDVLAPSTAKV